MEKYFLKFLIWSVKLIKKENIFQIWSVKLIKKKYFSDKKN